MKNKVLLITGGMGEIATAVIKKLSNNYSTLIAADIASTKESEAWLQELKNDGIENVIYRKMDVTNFDECGEVIGKLIEEYQQIDALINNAGITRDAVFHKMTSLQWQQVMSVNLDGMFNVTRQVVEVMREKEYGRIINISSVNGQKGQFSQANCCIQIRCFWFYKKFGTRINV